LITSEITLTLKEVVDRLFIIAGLNAAAPEERKRERATVLEKVMMLRGWRSLADVARRK
jgi:hypothetical protein